MCRPQLPSITAIGAWPIQGAISRNVGEMSERGPSVGRQLACPARRDARSKGHGQRSRSAGNVGRSIAGGKRLVLSVLETPRGKAGRGDRRTARGDPHTDGPRSSGGRRLVSVGRYALRGVSAAQELFTLDPSAYQKGPSTYACPCLLIGHDQTCCGIEGHHSITSSARRGRGRGRPRDGRKRHELDHSTPPSQLRSRAGAKLAPLSMKLRRNICLNIP